MKTLSRYAIALAAIVFCSISANAQRQSKLYIDDGHGNFETLSATLGGGSLTFPGGAAGTLLTTGNPTMITGVGIVTAGTWDGGIIQPIYGGTGLNSYVQGNILYASAANTLSALPPITNDGWVLTWNNTTTLPEWRVASGGGGGLAHITETFNNSTAPYSTGNAGEQLLASGTDANIDVALEPAGTGALEAQIADGTMAGGNKRGQNAVDWQTDRSFVGATGVASGSYATISGGYQNTASGYASNVSGGQDNLAGPGPYSTVSGGSSNTVSGQTYGRATISGGYANTVSGDFSAIPGGEALTLSGYDDFGFLSANDITGNPMSIAANNTSVFGNTNLWLANNNNTASALYFYAPYNTAGAFPNGDKFVGFKAGTVATSVIWTLPTADGSSGQALQTDGSGNLSWSVPQALNVYNQSNEVVANDAFVTFSSTQLTSGSISFSSTTNATIGIAGTYRVEFSVFPTGSSNYALLKNGTVIASSDVHCAANTLTHCSALITCATSDVINLVNVTGSTSTLNAGGLEVDASLEITMVK